MRRLVSPSEELNWSHVIEWSKDVDASFYGDGVDDDLFLWDRNWLVPLAELVERDDCVERDVILDVMHAFLYRIFVDDGLPIHHNVINAVEIAAQSSRKVVRDWADEQQRRIRQLQDGLLIPANASGCD